MNTAELCWLILLGVIVLVADYVFLNDPGNEALLSYPRHVIPFRNFNDFFTYVSAAKK